MNHDKDNQFADCPPELLAAHDRSFNHRAEVLESEACGCFCCCCNFAPSEIVEWTDDDKEGQPQTAVCPRCGIDSAIGDRSGVNISHDFLVRMREYWF